MLHAFARNLSDRTEGDIVKFLSSRERAIEAYLCQWKRLGKTVCTIAEPPKHVVPHARHDRRSGVINP